MARRGAISQAKHPMATADSDGKFAIDTLRGNTTLIAMFPLNEGVRR